MQPAFTEFDALFLDGPAGAGKTTAAVARIRALLDAGVAPILKHNRSVHRDQPPDTI